MLSLRQIEMLRAVMLTGSISKAATMLNVSPPSVSRMLKHTEAVSGVRFFERGPSGFVATPEARALLGDLEEIHARIIRINRRIEGVGDAAGERLAIGTTPGLGFHVAPESLRRLYRSAPHLRLFVDTLHVDEIVPALLLGQVDLALTIFDMQDPRVEVTSLAAGRMEALVPEGHPLAGRDKVSFAELATWPFIGFEDRAFQQRLITDLSERTGAKPEMNVRVRLMVSACLMVRQGFGVTIMDSFTAAGDGVPGTRTVPLVEDIPIYLNLVHAPQAPLSHIAERYVGIVREVATAG
ncbi:MAG: LysR family transcriptional regulator [Rhodospirillales bacterium]